VSAIFGEGVGYVPCPDAAEVYANEVGTERGRTSYFVAGPCECCFTDNFSRSETNSWGTADTGQQYDASTSPFSVDGSAGKIIRSVTGNTGVSSFFYADPLNCAGFALPATWLYKWRYSLGAEQIRLYISTSVACNLDVSSGFFELDGTGNSPGSWTPLDSQWYWTKITLTATNRAAKVWADGDAEPGSYAVDDPFSISPLTALRVGAELYTTGAGELDIDYVSVC
jgi:hypothetical protein